MSIEFSLQPKHEASETKRTLRRKKLIDHLITLAPGQGEPDVAAKAEQIVKALEADDPARQLTRFGDLKTLTVLSRQNPDEPRIHQALNDTAEHLTEAIEGAEPAKIKEVEGLANVWASLHAWDTARTEPTAKLCVMLLDNFRGEGQAHLAKAYIKARDQKIPFDQALDEVNAGDPTGEIAA